MSEIAKIKSYLGLGRAKKSLGQHFLTSTEVAARIVEAAGISPTDEILEIGPGLGILTDLIVKSPAKKIYLCEKDFDMCARLKETYKQKNLKIICDDALLLIPNLQAESPFKVISNLPYNISSPVIISLLSVCPTLPATMVLMLQKEVAERLTTPSGNKNRGLLTVFVELFGKAEIIENVSAGLFFPPPEVESAVIKISDILPLSFAPKLAIKVLKLAFSGKRKKIKNSLFSTLKISQPEAQKIAASCGISLDLRPEDLTTDQWRKLILALENKF